MTFLELSILPAEFLASYGLTEADMDLTVGRLDGVGGSVRELGSVLLVLIELLDQPVHSSRGH